MNPARLLLCLGLLAVSARAASIVNSPHNLSVSSPGTIKALTESQICIFCHTPHNSVSDAPLWNRFSSGETYIPYTSTTIKAVPGQPTGDSKLCLSCHDGTIALGMVRSRAEITMSSGVTVLPVGRSRLGFDLADDWPADLFDKRGRYIGLDWVRRAQMPLRRISSRTGAVSRRPHSTSRSRYASGSRA